ncbi:MAG: ATP-binding cassette domain-containing protein [Akkermansiaceae bacterium]|nr:ATP-binding cassette domain-containing protein [Verrucomicrobiales bacterium]
MNESATITIPLPILEMRGLAVASMKNPSVTVAKDLNWTVNAGEFWVVGAPQHSGKSDFLMTAGGIMSPNEGELSFLGERMPIFEEARMGHRLKLGFVFDGGQLLGSLTMAENIALPLRYHSRLNSKDIEARVTELLELTELTPLANRTPVNVARSWQQRTGLARALALSPEILLLDSPLSGLDMRHTAWWLGFLGELSGGHQIAGGKPITLVATADDLRPWRKHARQVACLGGKGLLVLGDWAAVDGCREPVVQELLRV